jgi:inner membrane protease ATP23
MKRIESRGCNLPEDFVLCEDVFGAGSQTIGAWDTNRHLVIMNPALSEKHMTQAAWIRTITHELIHGFDQCRVRMDPNDCAHVACTEIRAANLSGDCDIGAELERRGLRSPSISGHQQKCVRRRAELSARGNPACLGRDVPKVVDDVYEACYADTTPFPHN